MFFITLNMFFLCFFYMYKVYSQKNGLVHSMSGCPQCVWLFTVSGCPHSTACLDVQLFTMYLVVHSMSGCPQCVWLFTACLDVHTPQHVWMSIMCMIVHSMSGCPRSTACLDVHNVSGCPQCVWLFTACLP